MRPRIAVIGAGISGLGAAWLLRQVADVTLFEAEARLGGHADTFVGSLGGTEFAVDTGFIVLNDRTYPNLLGLFATLGVATKPTDMGFAVSVDGGRLEYAGDNIRKLFGQKRNLFRPRFHGMWRDILRFYREAPAVLATPTDETLGDWLDRHRYGAEFIDHHLLPMGAAIWSASLSGMRDFPVRAFVKFFANHGLLQVRDRPAWRTVTGGSRRYVDRIAADLADIRLATPVLAVRRSAEGVAVRTATGTENFAHAILATHAPQALALLEDPTASEYDVLRHFRTQANRAVLHTDARLMPRRRSVWSAWNVLSSGAQAGQAAPVSLTYWMNRLQNFSAPAPMLVSLNPATEPDPALVLKQATYAHPQFDAAALAAQARLPEIQGAARVHFCGAWTRWGFHEDGLASAVAAATALGAPIPWQAARAAAPAAAPAIAA